MSSAVILAWWTGPVTHQGHSDNSTWLPVSCGTWVLHTPFAALWTHLQPPSRHDRGVVTGTQGISAASRQSAFAEEPSAPRISLGRETPEKIPQHSPTVPPAPPVCSPAPGSQQDPSGDRLAHDFCICMFLPFTQFWEIVPKNAFRWETAQYPSGRVFGPQG